MAVRLAETNDGSPLSEMTGARLAIWRLDEEMKRLAEVRHCEVTEVIDFLLDLRLDLTKAL